MEKCQIYDKPILGINESADGINYWNKALDSFDKKQYKETILNVLNYINPSIVKERGNSDQTEFLIPHGSIEIELKIKDGKYEIIAPFLKLPDKVASVLLRQVSEINFITLFLSQIELRDDELYFHFSDLIELTEPYKIYDVFYEICIYADFYDDIFIDDLGAKRIKELKVKFFSDKELDLLWKKYNEYLNEAIQYIEYFQEKRWFGIGVDSVVTSLMKLDYYMQPQGVLRSDIEKAINSAHKQMEIGALLENLKDKIKELKEFNEKKFKESMYIPDFLISVKRRANTVSVKNALSRDFNSAKQDISESAYLSATSFLLYGIYNLLYRDVVPRKIEEILNKGLKDASDKPWKKAAEKLYKAVTQVMNMKD